MATAVLNIGSVTMPAGTYFVGDPCYAVPDERWMEWLEAANYMDERRYLVADLDGRAVLGIGTAHGDGQYRGSDGNYYPVDAGLIGVTPVAVGTGRSDLGTVVTFDSDFECTYEDGTIVLGHLRIDTDPEDDDYDDYYGRDDEDDDI